MNLLLALAGLGVLILAWRDIPELVALLLARRDARRARRAEEQRQRCEECNATVRYTEWRWCAGSGDWGLRTIAVCDHHWTVRKASAGRVIAWESLTSTE